ncbi:MAG: methylmalonyl Co-A mutase-associated GTPase MeaB [Ignavibacteria bacterium]|nr:methylmalonyl Co-A mutase-associated GTPase MeaB [Ignavibacteria bacterium]
MTHGGNIDSVFDGLMRGDRRSLAQSLSLIESTHRSDKDAAASLLERIAVWHSKRKAEGVQTPSRRIGITGAPGVGKSTLVEQFGLDLIGRGHRIAVLAVDPSSPKTGGSILGDKVRMPKLSVRDAAFIRPSPSKQSYSGTSDSTPDAILVCEAAGFDTVIVETVGVGQSATETANLVDLVILLVMPSSGDEVQGIKRGIMEVADVVAITKMDLDMAAASKTLAVYASALRLMMASRSEWKSPVISISATSSDGLTALHEVVDQFFSPQRRSTIESERNIQLRRCFDEMMKRSLTRFLTMDRELSNKLAQLYVQVSNGLVPPSAAVHRFLQRLNIIVKEKL